METPANDPPRSAKHRRPRCIPERFVKQSSPADTYDSVSGAIHFIFPNTITVGSVKAIRTQDIVTWNIISTDKWRRPIYLCDNVLLR